MVFKNHFSPSTSPTRRLWQRGVVFYEARKSYDFLASQSQPYYNPPNLSHTQLNFLTLKSLRSVRASERLLQHLRKNQNSVFHRLTTTLLSLVSVTKSIAPSI